MHDFDLHVPSRLEEASELLERFGDDARPLAGGTGLVQLMKLRLSTPGHLVSLQRLPGLGNVEQQNGELHIGALATHRQVERSPLVQELFPMLAETYRHVATVRIRSVATVGGGLAHADPAQDPQPTLISLDARVQLTSPGGQREVPVEELATDYYESIIEPAELLTRLTIPLPTPQGAGAFLKFLPRTADDYATVSAAAWVSLDPQGACQEVRIGLGSVGATAVRARQAESLLQGLEPTPERLRRAAEAVAPAISPLDDLRGSADYKREMATVIARRALETALARARG